MSEENKKTIGSVIASVVVITVVILLTRMLTDPKTIDKVNATIQNRNLDD